LLDEVELLGIGSPLVSGGELKAVQDQHRETVNVP